MGNDDILENNEIHDDYRISYIRNHIKELKKAIEIDRVDVLGYTPWGCIDIVSAGTGEMKKILFIGIKKLLQQMVKN